jgi:hypothetical protein
MVEKVSFIVGMLIGFAISFVIISSGYSIGDDTYLKPKLIELQCAEYNQTSGDFELRNLLKDVK